MAAATRMIRDAQSGIRSAVIRMSYNNGKEIFGPFFSLLSRQLSIFINISVVVLQVNLTFSEKPSCDLSLYIRVNFLNHLDETWQLLPHSVVLCEHRLFLVQECNHLLEPWLYLATWKDPTAWVRLCVHRVYYVAGTFWWNEWIWIAVSGSGKHSINSCRLGLHSKCLHISQFSSLPTLCHLLGGKKNETKLWVHSKECKCLLVS